MQFCGISHNWVLKVDLGTLLRDKYGHLFLWDLELFWPFFKVAQTKVENMHFCRLSWNLDFKVDIDTHLRDKHGPTTFMGFGAILALFQGCSNQGKKYALFFTF